MKNALLASNATWKITSSHDPFGIVTGGPGDRDSFGQEDLVYVIFTRNITGVVSLSSDVHFTSHVNMDPSRIQGNFTDFKPLDDWYAGSFGPNFMDTSSGARYEYGTCEPRRMSATLNAHF